MTNMETELAYLVCVGNIGASVIYTGPAIPGLWRSVIDGPSDWDGGMSFGGALFTIPDTSLYPFATYFPGSSQIMCWWASTGIPSLGISDGSPIAPGETRVGYRYLIQGAATSLRTSTESNSYMLFGENGQVLASGVTNDMPLPVEHETWGAIKSLYR